uniref:Hamartin n=1 Tax=Panagrellus redivivus TaxID=6233 RepID=A0A7E4VK66_PANRE
MAPEVAAQLARLEAVDAEVSSRAGAVLREWVAAGQAIGPLVDHYVRVKSPEALAVLAGIKEPYDEVLINKINDTFRRAPLEALGLLLRLMQFAPPWLRHVPKYSLFTALIERLKYDKIKTHADVELAVGILNILAGLVPHCVDVTAVQLERFFLAFTKGAVLYTTIMQNQTAAPSNFDVSIARVQASAVYAALSNFFEFVYATFPCNFAEFIRKQNQAYPSRTFVLRVLEPMSKSMRLNAKLFTGSCQKELVRHGFDESFAAAESLSLHDVPHTVPCVQPSLSATSSSSSLRLNPAPSLGSAAVPISTAPEWSPLEDLPLRPMTYSASTTMNSLLSDSFRPRVASNTMKPPPTKKVSLGERVNNFFKGTERPPKDEDLLIPADLERPPMEDAFCPYSSSFIDRRPPIDVKPQIEVAAAAIPADPVQPQKTGSKRRRCTSDPCGCRQHGSVENLDPEKYPHTFRILQSADHGVVTDSTLSRLSSAAASIRSDYLATSATYQNTLLRHGILASPDDEFAALENLKVDQQRDVLLMRARLQHQHLLYERYGRVINACRNSLLYERLRECQAVFGERDALKEQVAALKAELAAKDTAASEALAKMERERAEWATYESLMKAKIDDMAKERDTANSRAIALQQEVQQVLGRDADLRASRDVALRERDDLMAEYRFVNEQLSQAQMNLMRNTQLERRCQVLSETVQSLTRQVLDARGNCAVSAEVVAAPVLENAELRKQLSKVRRELRAKKEAAAMFPNRFDDVEWLLSVEGAMEAAFSVFEDKLAEHAAENRALRETNVYYLNHIYELKAELESERKHRLQGCYAGKAGIATRSPPSSNVDMSVISGLFANAPVAESPDNTPYYKSCIFGLDDDEVAEADENDPGDLDESMDVPKPHFAGNWGTGATNIPKAPTANSSTFNYDAILNHSTATAAFQMQHPAACIGYRQHAPPGKPQSPPQ